MKHTSRRQFIKRAALLGVLGTIVPGMFAKKAFAFKFGSKPDISIVKGEDLILSTQRAIDMLGGMKKFVKKGQKVGLLINSDFDVEGAYTHPDISLAVLKMVIDAGAAEVTSLQYVKEKYWKRSAHYQEMQNYLVKVNNLVDNQFPAKFENGGFVKRELPDSQQLKEAEVIEKLFDVDVLINLPIAKHHATTRFTGALKNMMGVNTRATNVFFHLNGPAKNDPIFIAQCIADINKMRPADLTVMDASNFITSNGPMGPGDMLNPNKVIAGKDMVAVDAIGCSYHDFELDEVPTLEVCEAAGLGTKDFNKLNVVEESI